MVLGGAMFTFDKLNKDFTSVDKVPAIAEFMPSRYIYEGLIVHQYKHNNYKKNFFAIEQQESMADFKQVHYLPELRELLNKCVVHVLDDGDRGEKDFVKDLELLQNELSKEVSRVPTIAFEQLEAVNPEAFDSKTGDRIEAYLNQLSNHYRDLFNTANAQKDQFITHNLNTDPERFNRIKDDHYNECILHCTGNSRKTKYCVRAMPWFKWPTPSTSCRSPKTCGPSVPTFLLRPSTLAVATSKHSGSTSLWYGY